MTFTPPPGWVALAQQFVKPAVVPRLTIKPRSGANIILGGKAQVTAMNPITRRRERRFGVAQGQMSMLTVVARPELLDADLSDCWAVLEAGFERENEWATIAQGRIKRPSANTKGTYSVEIHDSIMAAIETKLARDMMFQTTGWVSMVKDVSRAQDSKSYNNDWDNDGVDEGPVLFQPALCEDETFRLVFVTATTYKVIYEDGTETSATSITTFKNVYSLHHPYPADFVFKIMAEGWDQASGAYAAGDEFVVYTSKARTEVQLTPVAMVQHLIEDVGGLRVFDVLADNYYASPCYDSAYWAAQIAATSDHTIAGYWAKETRLIELVQDALKIVHGAIFPTVTGQIGLWVLAPAEGADLTLNGDRTNGQALTIIEALWGDDMDDVCNKVVVTYKSLADGEEASYEATDPDTPYDAEYLHPIDIGWRVRGLSIQSFAAQYINRFKAVNRAYTIQAILAGALANVADGVAITEPMLRLQSHLCNTTEVTFDVYGQRATITASQDAVAVETYARVGEAEIGEGRVW